jgi:hypothetical protein
MSQSYECCVFVCSHQALSFLGYQVRSVHSLFLYSVKTHTLKCWLVTLWPHLVFFIILKKLSAFRTYKDRTGYFHAHMPFVYK